MVDCKKNSIEVNMLSPYYRITLERRDRAATITEIAIGEKWLRRNGVSRKTLRRKVLAKD